MSRNTLGAGWLEYRGEDTQQEGIGQGNGRHMRQKRGEEDNRQRESGQEGKEDTRRKKIMEGRNRRQGGRLYYQREQYFKFSAS